MYKFFLALTLSAAIIHCVLSTCLEEVVLPDLYLRGQASNKCVGVHGYNLDNGGVTDMWDCVRGAYNEIWHYKFIKYQDINQYQLISTSSRKCLTAGSGGGNLATVTQNDCSSLAVNQLWYPRLNASVPAYFQLIGAEGQRCLTALGTFNGARLVLYDCLGWSWGGQLWHSDIGNISTTTAG
ncbi:extracellular exo-alpha-L-arabinofuranosidase-like [Folsomia candida]|uniref:extracellular exo-alpha-L-arabinofuranosidase-like n=1 Tax=Folsomia candida TaxID=158441 RepID=UPI001604E5C7|nr:extracellular exo-alpha-L-arabinofuranosidase-like [Folsomia candida]